MKIGAVLKKDRMALNYSQREVAQYTGIQISDISRIETGELIPIAVRLAKFAKVYKRPVEEYIDIMLPKQEIKHVEGSVLRSYKLGSLPRHATLDDLNTIASDKGRTFKSMIEAEAYARKLNKPYRIYKVWNEPFNLNDKGKIKKVNQFPVEKYIQAYLVTVEGNPFCYAQRGGYTFEK